MNKMKCIFPFVIGLLAVPVAMAQDVDFEKDLIVFKSSNRKSLMILKIRQMPTLILFLEKRGLSLRHLML